MRSTGEDGVAWLYNRNCDLQINGEKIYRRSGGESKWLYDQWSGEIELAGADGTIATFDDPQGITEDASAYPRLRARSATATGGRRSKPRSSRALSSTTNARLHRERRQLLEQREENTELVKAVKEERSLARKKAEAGLWTKTKWALFGMSDDESDE